MDKNLKQEILEQQTEVISENFVGMESSFFSLCPQYVCELLAEETEKFGWGIYVKGTW